MNNPMVQVQKHSFSKEDWHPDEFWLRSPVIQIVFSPAMCYLYRRTRHRKHPYRTLKARTTFALVSCRLAPDPSSRIVLPATPNRAYEGERDVAIASTLLLGLENCLYVGEGRGGGEQQQSRTG